MNINDNTIGYQIPVILHGFNGNAPTNAKVDTGAEVSSLHANNVTVTNNTVQFDFADKHINMPLAGYQSVKTADSGIEQRPVVKFAVTIPKDGTDKDVTLNNISFTLNDRSKMDDRILLGLNFIEAGKFTIASDADKPKKIAENAESKEETINNILQLIESNNIQLSDLIKLKEK